MSNLYSGIFRNFNEPYNTWSLKTIAHVVSKVEAWCDKKGLMNVELHEVEDNTWSDTKNQRFDIVIRYMENNHLIEQKLLMLKDEVIDGEEFHKRHDEFYPERKAV